MAVFFTVLVLVFVISVLAIVGYVLFELTPFARHSDHLRDPGTGKRRWESPRLD